MFEELLRLAYGQPSKKKKNFKVTENNMVIKISTHLQQPSQKRFKANYHPGA